MAVYGYARVSSRGQATDGNGLEVQVRQLRDAGCGEVVSEAFTGTKMERPELSKLLGRLAAGDTFVVTKLDRIARTSQGGCELVRDLMERGVTVRVLNMGTIEDTPIGRMMLTVMFAMAEFERDMIVQRMSEGKAAARASDPGYREGRPRADVDAGRFGELLSAQRRGEVSVSAACSELGIGRSTWYRLAKAS